MERHQLEDQIRASLQTRADDVTPTPALWERVQTRTARSARWRAFLWAVSGAAAVVAVVLAGMNLLGTPRGVQIDPQPADQPTSTAPTPTELPATPVPDPGPATPELVTTDGQVLYRVDAASGETIATLDPFEGFEEPAAIREVAVRPVSEEGVLTVATVIEIEGEYNVEISVFDADGQRMDNQRVATSSAAGADLPPDLVWSPDGRFVMWAGSNSLDDTAAGPALWAYDWVAAPTDDVGYGQPFTATAPGATGDLFADGGTVDLREWRGSVDDGGTSTVVASTTTGRALRIELTAVASDCGGATPCPPTFEAEVSDLGFEGASPVDLGTLDSGINLALVARPGDGQDAEGATLQLLAEPMSDQVRVLEVPELTAGTAAPLDAWMAVAGDRVVVGFGGQAHLLTVPGDVVEEVEVADVQTLEDGTTGAALAVLRSGVDHADSPTEPLPTASPAPVGGDTNAAMPDGLPAHVVTYDPADDRLALRDRTRAEPLATWRRPDAVGDRRVARVAVSPESRPGRVELATSWGSPGDMVLTTTVVVDGEVVTNEPFPAEFQPPTGGAVSSSPVFSPNGEFLAWLQPTTDGGVAVRGADWDDGTIAADAGLIPVDQDVTGALGALVDWAVTPELGSVLTALPADGTAQYVVEWEVLGTDGPLRFTDTSPRPVDMPGVVVDAGSFLFEDGSERYVVHDSDVVRYGLMEAPEAAVETGLGGPEAGRVVAFGPDSLLVELADGSWQRVQVDDGATSPVDVPPGTIAVLPWGTPEG